MCLFSLAVAVVTWCLWHPPEFGCQWERARIPPGEGWSISAEPSHGPSSARPMGHCQAPRPPAMLSELILAPASSEQLQNLLLSFFSLINCQCFLPLRTCSIWQQESTVGLAGTVVQSLEEFHIVTTHQNKLLSTDQNTKCCDSVWRVKTQTGCLDKLWWSTCNWQKTVI